jgi:uncharacterized protein DUF4037
MSASILDVSRDFFAEVVRPILERAFPEETALGGFGLFGLGSEAFGMDDALSRDHHWGVRIDGLLPDTVPLARREAMLQAVRTNLPATYRGYSLREGHLTGAGLTLDSLPAFLRRSIGLDDIPRTHVEWLQIPEEDILHVINGEVWHDPSGQFTAVRQAFQGYYPEPVRRRRLAHWCRYFSGMGAYALKRAMLRDNEFYAATAFGKAIRWGVQIAFLLDRRYFPYDKWLIVYLQRLPRLADPLCPLVEEAVRLSTPWERKLQLLDRMADLFDATMVADGLIRPHPRFAGSPTSGYRLLEHAYAELIQGLPDELKEVVPVWDQIYLEQFHSRYVDTIDMPAWDSILGLRPTGEQDRCT